VVFPDEPELIQLAFDGIAYEELSRERMAAHGRMVGG
jgi:hypothetical protein